MEELKGVLFDIQSYSVHDGPGCRTTIFMKGCFLNCEWCANPESWDVKKQLMYTKSRCKNNTGCTLCLNACKNNGVIIDENNLLKFNREKCNSCDEMDCAKVCYNQALKTCGKEYTVSEVMRIINRDRQFWRGNGGVTFSGGEPFFQKSFFLELLKRCKENYIHNAIETTAFIDTETFLHAMKYIDFAFVDIKHMDREKHREKTGVYNDIILKNIETLVESGWKGRLILRMPVIKDYNDTEENILQIIEFMKRLDLFEINLLPFHRLGDSKWNQLGKKYSYQSEEETPKEKLEYLQNIFLDNDISCFIGHETNF